MIEINIRQATMRDADRISEIYNYYILNTTVTFETCPISVTEMQGRIADVQDSGGLYFIAETAGRLVGYYYVTRWNGRCAYSTTKEATVYLDAAEHGKGIGTALYSHMITQVKGKDIHALIAGICIPNDASVRLHEKFGFSQVSHMKQIGRKFDQWQDVGHWQLLLEE